MFYGFWSFSEIGAHMRFAGATALLLLPGTPGGTLWPSAGRWVGGSGKIASLKCIWWWHLWDSWKAKISRHLLSTLAWGFSSKEIRFLPLWKQLTAFTSGEVFLCAAELTWKSENNSLRGSSVLPSPGFWGSNSSCQTWWQVPLPTEPSHSLRCA